MKNLPRFALTISAAALLAGCGGSQLPIGAPGAMLQSGATAERVRHSTAPLLPRTGPDGLFPVTQLTALNGKLYGTTQYGGAYCTKHIRRRAGLPGCGGSQAQPPISGPAAVPWYVRNGSIDRFISTPPLGLAPMTDMSTYKVSKGLLFVTDSDTFYQRVAVAVYDAKDDNPEPIATITSDVSAPAGDCIDGDGTLYVLNEGVNSNGWVSEYPIGKTKPLKIITNGINGPAFCAIDGQGNLWMTNNGGAHNVTEYLKGATEPHLTITKGLISPIGITFDHEGNLFVANHVLYGTTNVQVYPPGKKSPSRTITDGITWPVGIAVDVKGTLYVTNDNGLSSPCNVEEYRAGESHPFVAITDEINGPTAVTFNKKGRLYEVNGGTQGCSGPWPAILEFRPGSRKPSQRMITAYYAALGVAYYPALLP